MTPPLDGRARPGWYGRQSVTEIVRLRAGDDAYATAAQALLNQELGQGMYALDRLKRDAADPTAGVWVAITQSRQPVGAAVARLLIPEDAAYYLRFGPQAVQLFSGSVGSFEALAVERAYRRHGAGRLLTDASLDWMRQQGCEAAVTLAWLSGLPDSSPPLFRRLGFAEGPTVDRFYYEESRRDGWVCPVCRGPCRCAATLFTLTL